MKKKIDNIPEEIRKMSHERMELVREMLIKDGHNPDGIKIHTGKYKMDIEFETEKEMVDYITGRNDNDTDKA